MKPYPTPAANLISVLVNAAIDEGREYECDGKTYTWTLGESVYAIAGAEHSASEIRDMLTSLTQVHTALAIAYQEAHATTLTPIPAA